MTTILRRFASIDVDIDGRPYLLLLDRDAKPAQVRAPVFRRFGKSRLYWGTKAIRIDGPTARAVIAKALPQS